MLSIAVHRDFDKVSDDGFLTSYTDGNVRGYHSVTCVGFMEKNDMVYLIIVNSWGKEWVKTVFVICLIIIEAYRNCGQSLI